MDNRNLIREQERDYQAALEQDRAKRNERRDAERRAREEREKILRKKRVSFGYVSILSVLVLS